MKIILNILFFTFILALNSCAEYRNNIFPIDEKVMTENNWVIIKNSGQVINQQTLIDFNNYFENTKRKINILKYTREGDPIKIKLKAKGNKRIKYTNYRRDRFAPKWWNNIKNFQPINLFGIYREIYYVKKDKITYGLILSFNPDKCNGCWGWIIKIGKDTIKTDYLPFEKSSSVKEMKYPQPVKIEIGDLIKNSNTIDYKYYSIKSIELISNTDCSNIILYRFVGGKPDMSFINASKKVANEWGFEIQYEYGSCGRTEADKLKYKECMDKSKKALDCLELIFGKNGSRIINGD